MKKTAIILSAGKGTRLACDVPKQYLMVGGKPLLYYALKAFEESGTDDIIIVCGAGDEAYVRGEIVERFAFRKVRGIVHGGAERYDSVFCGLRAAEDAEIVLIHDGARPFISPEAIDRVTQAAVKYGAAVCGMPVKDTIKIADKVGFIESTTKRSLTWLMQTPQAFKYDPILKAYEAVLARAAAGENLEITDDTFVYQFAFPDARIKLIEGGYENIKITTGDDLDFARWKLEN